MEAMKELLYDVGFWSGWAILPVLLELLPACIGTLLLFRRRRRADACPALERFQTFATPLLAEKFRQPPQTHLISASLYFVEKGLDKGGKIVYSYMRKAKGLYTISCGGAP
ncbi:MAG: hypothetical protein LUD69_06040 [Oscillospiraceae bacterium]|nr:hypothetical protein [Oscillospiraceae bacterium]